MENQDWRLTYMNIQEEWNNKGRYKGTIKFKTGGDMEVSFVLDEARCRQYLSLLSEDLVKSASQMGNTLINSLPVALPPSSDQEKQIS